MASILVIDPSPRNRMQVERILRLRTEHTVTFAQDGVEAFECLRQGLPDLILMDLFLPRVDGFHVHRVLKEHVATARIPIILSTSVNLDAFTEAKVRQLQLEGRVEMPVSSAELIEVISLVLLRQKPVSTFQKEQIEGEPQDVTRVVWPRVERPDPPPEPEKPAPPREVKSVVWPKAGTRKDAGGSQKTNSETEGVPSLPPPKPSGREIRARLAMLATGQLKPDPNPEPEGKEKVPSPESRVPSRRRPATRDPRPETQGPADPTQEQRVRALLRYADKPSKDSPKKPEGFQAMPLKSADPARIIDFTRKKKDAEPPPDRRNRPPEKKGENPSPGSSGGEEQHPVIRPVQWTQIKKKE
ncbi:MAG: response regulator [Candidatus Latescibacteria bacterium]|nr:response regulator [Candidatus Latescibacterota bacterium]